MVTVSAEVTNGGLDVALLYPEQAPTVILLICISAPLAALPKRPCPLEPLLNVVIKTAIMVLG
jgi:hypothetical protein